MWSLGPLSFSAPWLLAALVLVPGIIWLLRVTPPGPKRVTFPAIRFLLDLPRTRDEPARTPLWLLILRAFIAILIILALSGPIWRAVVPAQAPLPLLIAIDDGWAAAEGWAERKRVLLSLVDAAARENRGVALLTTAPRLNTSWADVEPPQRLAAADIRARLDALEPVPWPVDRAATAKRLDRAKWTGPSRVIWLTDGLDTPGVKAFEAALARRGQVTVSQPEHGPELLLIGTPHYDAGALNVTLHRAHAASPTTGRVSARGRDGRVLGEAPFAFTRNAREAIAHFALPPALINDIARFEIDGHRSAGAVALLDDSHRKHNVGLVSGGNNEESQPLLSDLFYLDRALAPFADVTRGTIASLATPDCSILMLADVGRIPAEDHDRLVKWVEAGGTLVRFAGPRLAAQSDDLVPVPLRHGGRSLGGALSWDTPEPLGSFEADGPFAGLTPTGDIHVKRQVLAEPVPDLASRTWARLADGTPLVTAAPRGAGRLVLIHVTANTDWSDLPLSGVYVEMLRRLVMLASAAPGAQRISFSAAQFLPPLRLLDGYGALSPPRPGAEPLRLEDFARTAPGPKHPPGLYGHAQVAKAFNLGDAISGLAPLAADHMVTDAALRETHARDLKPWLLASAILLVLIDGVAGLFLGGGWPKLRRAAGALLILSTVLPAWPAHAQPGDADAAAIEAVRSFRLAYVRTGNAKTDAISKAGLAGLSQTLSERSAVEPAKPFAVDLETDELAFFPLIYWQVPVDQPPLSDAALARLDRFMKTGGTLVIDTADADQDFGAGAVSPGQAQLRALLAKLDLPPLELVGPDHVLTKSFYLLQEFPGRYANGKVWVEAARGGADHDGVASLIVGSNDWAAAWARNARGQPLVPVTPGGEQQRERALRFGVNLVMYALTGNYKADQVHVPALLERLGQ